MDPYDYEMVLVPRKSTESVVLSRNAIEPRRNADERPRMELRQLFFGTLFEGREKDLHHGHPRPTTKQLAKLYFIEHPSAEPRHPDAAHRHHTENVIIGS